MYLPFITSDWGMSFIKCYWLCLLKCSILITSSYLLWETTKQYVHFKAPGKLSKKWKFKGFCASNFYLGNGEGYSYRLLLTTGWRRSLFNMTLLNTMRKKPYRKDSINDSVGYVIIWKRGPDILLSGKNKEIIKRCVISDPVFF